MKRTVLKNWVSYSLYAINVWLVMLDVMLLAEANTCFLFYSISINVIVLNTAIIHRYSSTKFIKEHMNIFAEEE